MDIPPQSAITRDNVSDYRSVFSAVFSEFYMFRRLYGLSEAETARLKEHLVEMGLTEGVVIEDGAFANLALSTGQMRQASKFAILVLSKTHGAAIMTVDPPSLLQ